MNLHSIKTQKNSAAYENLKVIVVCKFYYYLHCQFSTSCKS